MTNLITFVENGSGDVSAHLEHVRAVLSGSCHQGCGAGIQILDVGAGA